MIRTWWQRLANQKATLRSQRSHARLQDKLSRRLRLEWLESRLAPATHTWTGATSALWSVDTNWNGGSPAGDAAAVLVFPGGTANLSNMNDVAGLTIQSITFSGSDNYTITGNGITLNAGGITTDITATSGTDMINLPMALGSNQTWTVTNASRTLQVGGVISGIANLSKSGMGTLLLTGTNTYTGSTTIAAGSLLVNGSQPGSNVVVDSGATLGGSGTVGTITTSGAIIPGGPGAGILHSGNVAFGAGSSLVVQLTGTSAGTGYSQLNVTGTVNLSGNPTLTVTLGSFAPAVGNTFMPIVSTGALTGTFSGIADNGTLTVSGRNFRVNYQTNDLLLTMTSLNSQTVVSSSTNPSVFGQPITFTATVTATVRPVPSSPTGTVTFRDGTNTLGTGTLNASGVATFSPTTPFSVGTHSVTAVYNGDSNFAISTSTVLTQTVNPAPTTITVSSSANPATSGQALTFTATVTPTAPGAGTPTGVVTFRDGSTTLGTGTLNSSSVATFSPTTPLSVGTHSITAIYSGDNNFATSTSTALMQTINAAGTAVTMTVVTSSPNPSSAGQLVTFTATVSPILPVVGTPTGTVTFRDGMTTLGTATLSGGRASFSTGTLSAGLTHSITAVYSGDSSFATSTSAVLTQTVTSTVGASLNQLYVTQLYSDVLRRAPDTGGLTFWTGLLDQSRATRTQVALGFVNSTEYRMLEVENVYRTYLLRDVDPTGLSSWTQYLVQGHTLEQLEVQIVISPEYLQRRAGGNTNNFLATLFMDAFNRALDQAGRDQYGGEDFSSANDRREVAEKIFGSTEFRHDLVQSYYQRFLNRTAESGGLNAFTNALNNGATDEDVIAAIVSSQEYLANRVPAPTA